MQGKKAESLQDEVVNFLRESPDGVSSQELAQRFLKFKAPDKTMAHTAIRAILARDLRCSFGNDSLWHAVSRTAVVSETLQSVSWATVYLLVDPERDHHRVVYVSAWSVGSEPECLKSGWLIDPRQLSIDERETLQCRDDSGTDPTALITAIASALEGRTIVFLASSQQYLLNSLCLQEGCDLTDDIVTAGELLRAAGQNPPRPLTVESLSSMLLGVAPGTTSVRKLGEGFALAVGELLEQIRSRGIETRADLDLQDREEKARLFSGKKFGYDNILAAYQGPGVYGFKDVTGKHIYIGKARNLRRRLLSYFRPTDESPAKLEQLRSQAHELVTHVCGSELESLIYEYRLIRKYAPPLNRQTDVHERKGTYAPISDCVVLLPHAEADKGMSFWFRREQKILLKPFDASLTSPATMIGELEEFFFADKLAADPSDFPEQEIAVRWIKAHAEGLTVVPVSRMGSAQEIFEGIRSYWRDLARARQPIANGLGLAQLSLPKGDT